MPGSILTTEQVEMLEEKIEGMVSNAFDSRLRKLFISMWVTIIGSLGSLIYLGVQWGVLKTTVEENVKQDHVHHTDLSLHMPLDKKFEVFVTRSEWSALIRERDRDIDDLKEELIRVNLKLDKLSDNLLPKNGASVGVR